MSKQRLHSLTLPLLLVICLLLAACGSGGSGDTGGFIPPDTAVPPEEPINTLTLTLDWDASEDSGVIGYKIYYNSSEATFPVGIVGANEGVSPLDVGSQTSSVISGLLENEIHYFAVTAYDEFGNESTFSKVVSTQ